jgi:hypothetical protein
MARRVITQFNQHLDVIYTAAENLAGDGGFAAMVNRSPQALKIDGITWGVTYGTAADKALHNSIWLAVLEAFEPDPSIVSNQFSVLNAERDSFPGGMLRYVSYNGAADGRSEDFSAPIIIPPGRVVAVLVNRPYTSAAIASALIISLNVRGGGIDEPGTTSPRLGGLYR